MKLVLKLFILALAMTLVSMLMCCSSLMVPDYSQGNAYVSHDNICIRQRVYVDFSGDRFILYTRDFDLDVRKLEPVSGLDVYTGSGKDGNPYTISFPRDPYVIVMVVYQNNEIVVSHKCMDI